MLKEGIRKNATEDFSEHNMVVNHDISSATILA